MLGNGIWKERTRIILGGATTKFKLDRLSYRKNNIPILPKSSEVLKNQLKQRNYPHWTAW